MKKVCYFLTAAALCVSMTSCLSSLPTTTITPVATNTMNSVSFSELNLSREDYKILNTIEVSSVVTVNYQDSPNNSTITIIKITDDGGYSVELTKNKYCAHEKIDHYIAFGIRCHPYSFCSADCCS